MNKKIFILMTVLFLLAAKGYCRKKVRNNELLFSGDAKKSVVLHMKSYCISPKQPFNNPNTINSRFVEYDIKVINTSKNTTKKFQLQYRDMTIVAGRHGSEHTVKCLFNKGFHKQNLTFNKRPHKLNFAVIGTLTIDGVSFDDMVLAQGHTSFSNNWWFGGKNCKYLNSGYNINAVNCTATDKKTTWCFFRGHVDADFNGGTHIDSTGTYEVRVWNKKCVLD